MLSTMTKSSSLYLVTPRLVSGDAMLRIVAVRCYASHALVPKPAKIQMQKPTDVEGYWHYERYYNRDSRYSPQPGFHPDTPKRFMVNVLKHNWELYPLWLFFGGWFIYLLYVIYWSFGKLEIWVDKRSKVPPWDWSRIRDNYWKHNSQLYDPTGGTHARMPPIFEKLQDEMLAAAIERGTRKSDGRF